MTKHPRQPVELDARGVPRFKSNAIVRWLLDNGDIDMNKIALQGFARDEYQHFVQLAGYSVDGYAGLSYADKAVIRDADIEAAVLLRAKAKKKPTKGRRSK